MVSKLSEMVQQSVQANVEARFGLENVSAKGADILDLILRIVSNWFPAKSIPFYRRYFINLPPLGDRFLYICVIDAIKNSVCERSEHETHVNFGGQILKRSILATLSGNWIRSLFGLPFQDWSSQVMFE